MEPSGKEHDRHRMVAVAHRWCTNGYGIYRATLPRVCPNHTGSQFDAMRSDNTLGVMKTSISFLLDILVVRLKR